MKIHHNALASFPPVRTLGNPLNRVEKQFPAAAKSPAGVWAAVSAHVRTNPGAVRMGTFESQYPNLSSLGRAVKGQFENAMKGLESQDRLGNFEIQRLMSAFNQAETLSSNVQKKMDDTANSVIGKI